MSFLEKIRPFKEAEVARLQGQYAQEPARRPEHLAVRDFRGAVSGGGVIAEIKFKSPSHPEFRQDIAPGRLAGIYERHGAAALSIVTDAPNFGTSLADVPALHAASGLPVITKDFIIDPVQVQAAWAAGADAVLLIVSMLERDLLERLLAEVKSLGLVALVECHGAEEIETALAIGAELVGVNNRNLATLTTDLEYGGGLLPLIPSGVVRVSESGLNTRSDIERMSELGADAFLVGHALLMSGDPGRKVGELCGRISESGTRVKICGLTNPEDAVSAATTGADILGVIFADSPRCIDGAKAVEIRRAVPDTRLCGVFMDQSLPAVAAAAIDSELDLIQLHGKESPDYCRQLKALTGLPLIKVLRPEEAVVTIVRAYDAAAYFLIDLPKNGSAENQPDPAEAARAAGLVREMGKEVILAGALTPDNVGQGIRSSRPYGVDVCSGVEKSRGQKNPELMEAFVKETQT